MKHQKIKERLHVLLDEIKENSVTKKFSLYYEDNISAQFLYKSDIQEGEFRLEYNSMSNEFVLTKLITLNTFEGIKI